MNEKNSEIFELNISSENENTRLDVALSKIGSIGSRSKAAKLIQAALVTKAGKKVKASQITCSGEVYQVQLEKQPVVNLAPYDFPLDVVHEDDDLIVINKPAGLVVHPAVGHQDDTLVNALIHHCKTLSLGFNESRPGIVHRLDKDTSGLIIVAKTNKAHAHLADQFKDKTAGRVYWALVFGSPKEKNGTISTYLGRNQHHRKKMCSLKQLDPESPVGKLAITHYKTLAQHASGVSLIECRLETGRTHQIRVHMSDLNCPILGDELYGGVKRSKNLKSVKLRTMIKNLQRVALHAQTLEFVHPTDKKSYRYSVSVPTELKVFFNELGFSFEN